MQGKEKNGEGAQERKGVQGRDKARELSHLLLTDAPSDCGHRPSVPKPSSKFPQGLNNAQEFRERGVVVGRDDICAFVPIYL